MTSVMHLEPPRAQEGLCPKQKVHSAGVGKNRSGKEACVSWGPSSWPREGAPAQYAAERCPLTCFLSELGAGGSASETGALGLLALPDRPGHSSQPLVNSALLLFFFFLR